MPVFRLSDQIQFPSPNLAEDNGLLAIGGDLSPERLISAYSRGIFPWFSEGDPILWWCTSPRLVIFLKEFHIPKRLARYIKTSDITITRNCAFTETIRECAKIRTEHGDETWILPEMVAAYTKLHQLGFAHSFECWQQDKLIGGLYGIALGKVFFGESMFSRVKCASQFALVALVDFLKKENFTLIDCQMTTNHLIRFGAREISSKEFQDHLKANIKTFIPHKEWKHEN